jgi:hypothetical protein
VLCAVRCRLHAAGSRLPGPRYGLGLLLSDLLQVCMPVRLILVQGPGDCRRLLLSYLRLSLGQPGLGEPGLGPGGPGPCGLGCDPFRPASLTPPSVTMLAAFLISPMTTVPSPGSP